MKKILILVLAFIVIGIAYMVKNGTAGIMSSVLIGAQKYPDGTPTSLETALITPDGFTLERSLNNPKDTFQANYVSNSGKEKYGVQIRRADINSVNLIREAIIRKFLGTTDKKLLDARLSQYLQKDVIAWYEVFSPSLSTDSITGGVFWMTEFGYVRIYQDSISVKSTSAEIQQANWNKIHNDLLEIATTYIQKHPPISASQYDKFGKYSADIIKKIDLTKLPQLAQK